jgi:hypothetical protein
MNVFCFVDRIYGDHFSICSLRCTAHSMKRQNKCTGYVKHIGDRHKPQSGLLCQSSRRLASMEAGIEALNDARYIMLRLMAFTCRSLVAHLLVDLCLQHVPAGWLPINNIFPLSLFIPLPSSHNLFCGSIQHQLNILSSSFHFTAPTAQHEYPAIDALIKSTDLRFRWTSARLR